MKLHIAILVIGLASLSTYICVARYPGSPLENDSPFSYYYPNQRDAYGRTILDDVTQEDREHILSMLKFFLSYKELNINNQDNQGYTPLANIFLNRPTKDSDYLVCVKLFCEDKRFVLANHQKTINEGFDDLTNIYPISEDYGIFFDLPLVDYVLQFVNDKALLIVIEGDTNQRLREKHDEKYMKELMSFLEKLQKRIKQLP